MAKNKIDFPSQLNLEEKISTWAHDLRSPFNHLIGFTKLVLNGQSGPLTDLQKEDLTTVFHSSLRAMSLMNNLIEIARLQMGEKQSKPELVELQPFLDQSIAQWKKFNPDKTMPIATLVTTNSSSVKFDPGHTQWILNGLFSYLVAYSDDTGHVTLEVEEDLSALVFTLRQMDISKLGQDTIALEMFAYISKVYTELQGGEILQSQLNETQALIRFSLPK